MAQLSIRDLGARAIERLKLRARHYGRSLRGKANAIIEPAAPYSSREAQDAAAEWQRRLAGGDYSDSAEAIRQHREMNL